MVDAKLHAVLCQGLDGWYDFYSINQSCETEFSGGRKGPDTVIHLHLEGADFTEAGMPSEADWAACSTELFSVNLRNATGVTKEGVAALLKACPDLSMLNLGGTDVRGYLTEGAAYVQHAKLNGSGVSHLASVVLREGLAGQYDYYNPRDDEGCNVHKTEFRYRFGEAKGPATCVTLNLTEADFTVGGGMPSEADWATFGSALKKVDLINAKGVTVDGIATLLKACPNLEELLMFNTGTVGFIEGHYPNLRTLKGGHRLRFLSSESYKQYKAASEPITSSILRYALGGLLDGLDFGAKDSFGRATSSTDQKTEFSDDANKIPATCTKLSLHNADFTKEGGMPSEADWRMFAPSLKAVDLTWAKGVTSDGIAVLLTACPYLETLDLEGTKGNGGEDVGGTIKEFFPKLSINYSRNFNSSSSISSSSEDLDEEDDNLRSSEKIDFVVDDLPAAITAKKE